MSKSQLKLAKQLKMQVAQLTKGLNSSLEDSELSVSSPSGPLRGEEKLEATLPEVPKYQFKNEDMPKQDNQNHDTF